MDARLQALLSARNEYRLLGLMLLLLHLSLWWNFGGSLSRSLMLAHLGLFLIWQPVWRRDERLALPGSLVFILATVAFVLWLNWWLMAFWLLLLTGVVGGRITRGRADHYAYLLTLLFLVCELLIGCIPPMFDVHSLSSEVANLFKHGLLVLPAALILVRGSSVTDSQAHRVDFLYGLTAALLTSVLALGSLLNMYYSDTAYAVALFQTILVIAVFLLAIGWLWMPFASFSGFGQLWERYILNIGTPFERWLSRLSEIAKDEQEPTEFLNAAMLCLSELPWIAGVEWQRARDTAKVGHVTAYSFQVTSGELQLRVYAHRTIGTGLLLHGKLLIQLVTHFYHAKEREQELTHRTHLQAIHETGARVTHDIKNLLQSLQMVTTVVQHQSDDPKFELQQLLQRQLPHITQRLQLALDKLQAPQVASSAQCQLSVWWKTFKSRNKGHNIQFDARVENDLHIPPDLFDSVSENLLENARFKRNAEPQMTIGVTLVSDECHTRLRISDNGSAIESELAKNLFKAPVASRSGLGVGLYQAANHAQQHGYTLSLATNEEGHVCFELSREFIANDCTAGEF